MESIDQVAIVPLQDVLAARLMPRSDSDEARAQATAHADDRSATVFEYMRLAHESRIVVSERDEVEAHGVKLVEQLQQSYEAALTRKDRPRPPSELFADWATVTARLDQGTELVTLGLDDDAPEPAPKTSTTLAAAHVRCQPALAVHGRLADWVTQIRARRDEHETTLFVAASVGRAERTIELLKEYEILAVPVDRADDARYASVLVAVGVVSEGFRLPAAGLQIYAETDVFDEERRAPERRRSATKAFLSDLRDLKVGDLVVHVDHGIGTFVALKQIGVTGDAPQDFLELRYAGDDKLFVPVECLDLVQKYTGVSRPLLDRLGGAS